MAKIKLKTVGNVLVWALSILLAAAYLLDAYPKLTGSQGVVEQFESFGYSQGFRVLIGVLEGVGAVMLLFPRLAFWGAALLSVVMIGAAYSHLATGLGSPFHALRNLVLLAIIARVRWKQAYLIRTRLR